MPIYSNSFGAIYSFDTSAFGYFTPAYHAHTRLFHAMPPGAGTHACLTNLAVASVTTFTVAPGFMFLPLNASSARQPLLILADRPFLPPFVPSLTSLAESLRTEK